MFSARSDDFSEVRDFCFGNISAPIGQIPKILSPLDSPHRNAPLGKFSSRSADSSEARILSISSYFSPHNSLSLSSDGRTGLPHQTPVPLQGLPCLTTTFVHNILQVVQNLRTSTIGLFQLVLNFEITSLGLEFLLLLESTYFQLQTSAYQALLHPPCDPAGHSNVFRLCDFNTLKWLTLVSILMNNDIVNCMFFIWKSMIFLLQIQYSNDFCLEFYVSIWKKSIHLGTLIQYSLSFSKKIICSSWILNFFLFNFCIFVMKFTLMHLFPFQNSEKTNFHNVSKTFEKKFQYEFKEAHPLKWAFQN